MSGEWTFRDVKLQWLQQLSCDAELSDCAKCVALHLATTYMNGHTGKAWPSYQTLATALGKSVKTIQRAIKELESRAWLEVRRGNGVGHNTEYCPSRASIIRASAAREKTDKVVPLRPAKGGQDCPGRRSDVSAKGGQNCPPNLYKEKINNPRPPALAREQAPAGSPRPRLTVLKSQVQQLAAWEDWLHREGLPPIARLCAETFSSQGPAYHLPKRWPPEDGGEHEAMCRDFFRSKLPSFPSLCHVRPALEAVR